MAEETLNEEAKFESIALVIFLARESLQKFADTFEAACVATQERATIDILVNGNFELAHAVKLFVRERAVDNLDLQVRVWNLYVGDKANAWNAYIQYIWKGESIAFFIDGYVRLQPMALQKLKRSFQENPRALGGTGVPTEGRSSKVMRARMLEEGGFHGNLCCIKGSAIAEMRHRSIRIPVGLYRVDSLMGAILYFGLNPKENEWQTFRIVVERDASWSLDGKYWWRFSDLKAKKRQIERQLRGLIENAAVKYFFKSLKRKPEELAQTCTGLIQEWEMLDPEGFGNFVRRHPIATAIYRRSIRQETDWSKCNDLELLIEVKHRKEIRVEI